MRRNPFVPLILGVVLLSAALLSAAGAVSQERQQDQDLQRDADQIALAFGSYFERARSLDLLLAQNTAFTPGGAGRIDRLQASRALRYLGDLYPGAIGEACLIDGRGHEIARVTEGVAASAAELSTEEAKNAFFGATLALDVGHVHQAPPYVSPDTHNWVISNSTPIRQPDGKPLVVHFEITLASFRQYLTTSSAYRHVAVVDRSTGQVILSDSDPLPPITGRFPTSAVSFAVHSAAGGPTGSGSGIVEVDEQRVAVSGVAHSAANGNDWVIVEWSSVRASLVPLWVGSTASVLGLGLVLFYLVVLRRQQSGLRLAARRDHLTGMANRKALEEALDEAIASAAEPDGDRMALLMLDLDGFKQINDTLGHDKGDLVLQEIGRRLHANTLEFDTAARMGGDEFAVVLRHLREADDVAAVGHRLREALIRPIMVDGVARFIGASIGGAIYAEHGRTSAELLRAADAAMYHAKRGREGVRLYDAGTAAGANDSGLAAELLLAIESDELTLAFQPEYALTTGEVAGVEALSRWQRTDLRDVAPSDFIPLAEQTGLIRQLTHLTLRKALDEVQIWHDHGVHIPISVNLSAQLVADRSLPSVVNGLLAERGLTGAALVLEITETAVINDLEVAVEALHGLRAIGVRIELDDFGSGYASFKALHDLPLDGVKIDQELVNDLGPGGQRLLAATIDIGRRLGLKVVAEGIEDANTLELVHLLGADNAQGFHLASPMGAHDLRLLLGVDLSGTPDVGSPAGIAPSHS